jgi:hypothetical protein
LGKSVIAELEVLNLNRDKGISLANIINKI